MFLFVNPSINWKILYPKEKSLNKYTKSVQSFFRKFLQIQRDFLQNQMQNIQREDIVVLKNINF